MTPGSLLGAALLCVVTSVAAQDARSDAMAEYREQFRKYVGSWETSADEILQEVVASLTPGERRKVPSELKVRIGWSQSSARENGITGCGTLGQPASLDRSSATIWLCEEGTRTVAALLEIVLVTEMAARVVALEIHQGQMSSPSPAMLQTYNSNYKKWGKPTVDYLMTRYVDQVNGPLLNRFAPRSCLGYVLAYLTVHDQSKGAPIVCSRENPNADVERLATTWLGSLLGKTAQQTAQMLGVSTGEPVAVPPEGIGRYRSEILRQVIRYFVLHELGHLVMDSGHVPVNSARDKLTAAEVVADRFAFDDRFGAIELKPFVMVALLIFWDDLAVYAGGPGTNTEMVSTRSKSIETLMCAPNRAWHESPDPTVNGKLMAIQRETCTAIGQRSDKPNASR